MKSPLLLPQYSSKCMYSMYLNICDSSPADKFRFLIKQWISLSFLLSAFSLQYISVIVLPTLLIKYAKVSDKIRHEITIIILSYNVDVLMIATVIMVWIVQNNVWMYWWNVLNSDIDSFYNQLPWILFSCQQFPKKYMMQLMICTINTKLYMILSNPTSPNLKSEVFESLCIWLISWLSFFCFSITSSKAYLYFSIFEKYVM